MATATRILVQCRTRQMPGSPNEKIGLMADAACQKVWNRNFDHAVDGDRLMSFGGHVNPMCILLVDHGDVEAPEQTTIQLSWNGRELYVLKLLCFPFTNCYIVSIYLDRYTHIFRRSLEPNITSTQLLGKYP